MTSTFMETMTSKEQSITVLPTRRSFTLDLPWPLD
jgi:hypothetical protein